MIRVNYRTLRRLTFSIYVLLSVMFCLLLIYLGRNEIRKARHYAENEKKYFASLLQVREALDRLDNSFNLFLDDTSPGEAENCREKTRKFWGAVNHLAIRDRERTNSPTIPLPQLPEDAQQLHSTAVANCQDFLEYPLEREILLGNNIAEMRRNLANIRKKVQLRLNSELGQVEKWQRQSFFFFNRLQYLLILFFVLTTVFSAAASILFGNILRKSVKSLRNGTKEISTGNLKYRFDHIQTDEIGSVMYDFNLMARRLEQQTEALYQANRELEDKATQLVEAHKSKDRFLANMSHELRTPLNSIIGFSDLIIKKAETSKDPGKSLQYAERILNGAEHLLDLISDLLEVAKVDAGVLKPEFKEFKLGNCLDRVIGIMRPLAQQKGLEIDLQPIPEDLALEADERLLRQVLINLINNAVKYSHEGRVNVQAKTAEDQCQIAITDNGIGISQADQENIFRDFHRVEQGLTSNYEGVGLGLTLSKRIVELHHGRIIVESELEKGSTFTVIIPLQQPIEKDPDSDEK